MTDWTGNEGAIELAIDWPLRGLLLSIADEGWHERWGPRPEERQEREARVRTLAAAGPQFVPVFGHRYLAGPPDREGNPVLSIYGADVVVYSENLRSWLRLELSVPERVSLREVPADDGARIPFWGDVIAGLS